MGHPRLTPLHNSSDARDGSSSGTDRLIHPALQETPRRRATKQAASLRRFWNCASPAPIPVQKVFFRGNGKTVAGSQSFGIKQMNGRPPLSYILKIRPRRGLDVAGILASRPLSSNAASLTHPSEVTPPPIWMKAAGIPACFRMLTLRPLACDSKDYWPV